MAGATVRSAFRVERPQRTGLYNSRVDAHAGIVKRTTEESSGFAAGLRWKIFRAIGFAVAGIRGTAGAGV